MSEKWEILHFPLLREKTSFIRQQRHDKVRAKGGGGSGVGGAHVALIRNSQGVTSVGGDKYRRAVHTRRLSLPADITAKTSCTVRRPKPANTPARRVGSGLCAAATDTQAGVSLSNRYPPPKSRGSGYIHRSTSCFQHAGAWLYQNKPYHSSAELNGLTERRSIFLPHP